MPGIYTFLAVYRCLIVLRVILVLIPQTGYIHPDEFFQPLEVLIGDFFDVECNHPREYNSTFPLRSMAIPYFTIGTSYKVLNIINNFVNHFLGGTILTPYTVIVMPRLLMCLFSFIVDSSLYKICVNNSEKCKSRLLLFSSSYVMLVYATRTFPDTIELVLFSVLLYYVCESATFSNRLIRERERLNVLYEQSRTRAMKKLVHFQRLSLPSDSFRNCFIVSTISVLGFFNRPTFLAFALMPIFFWLYRGMGTKWVTFYQFHLRMLVFVLCAIPGIILCILVDSFYYGYITWEKVGMLDVSIDNFVFIPLNILRYNFNVYNLAIHGPHHRFLHVLVNIPLLFNILGICALSSLLRCIYTCVRRRYHRLPSIRSMKCLMTFSFFTPVTLLSIFPHQEPRFLIPVILPLVYLQGTAILAEPGKVQVEVDASRSTDPRERLATRPTQSYSFLKIWVLANILLIAFYGFLHQGGIYHATRYIFKDLERTPSTTELHIVTSHIYPLPQSFLMQKPSSKLHSNGNIRYSDTRRVFLYEEGSKNMEHIFDKLQDIINGNRSKCSRNKKIKVYLLISSSLDDRLYYSKRRQFFTLNLVETFYPHLSVEAVPDLTAYCVDIMSPFYGQTKCTRLSYGRYLTKIFNAFRLNLYEVLLNDI